MRLKALVLLPSLAVGVASAHAQDIEAGEKVFAKCKACHVVDQPANRVGPSLQGVFGRTAGTHEGFRYSPAMKEAGENGLVWDKETLTEYLHDPKGMVPKTRMVFPGIKDEEELTNLLTYLEKATGDSE